MDLYQLILQSKTMPVAKLLRDETFKKSVIPRTVFATSRASELLFNRPYVDPRNAEFVRSHNESWAKTFANLANWEQSPTSLVLPRNERVLVAGWHFPEIPTIFTFAKKIHALLLVSQDAPWLESLKEAGCTLNLFAPGASKQLIKEMQTGRVVAAMLDHAYPDTRCEKSSLLGRTVNTPSGILELCSRFKYLMVFVAPRTTGVEVVAQIDTTDRSGTELAQQYNSWLEAEVKKNPAAWLMWQALPPR